MAVDEQRGNGFKAAAAMLRLWTDCTTSMMEAAMSPSPHPAPVESARQIQDRMLSVWGEHWERFMRSPEFLQGMKQWLGATLQLRRQLNDALGQMRHELQGTSRQDIDQLMLTTRHLEHRVIDAIERLSERVDELHDRLEALKGSP